MECVADRDLRARVLGPDAGHDCRPLLRRDPVRHGDFASFRTLPIGIGATGMMATVLGREAIQRNHTSMTSDAMPHSRISRLAGGNWLGCWSVVDATRAAMPIPRRSAREVALPTAS